MTSRAEEAPPRRRARSLAGRELTPEGRAAARLGASIRDPERLGAFSLRLLAVLALLYTAYVGQAFLTGVVMAMILKAAAARPVRALARKGIPKPIGAAVVLMLAFAPVVAVAYVVTPAALRWVDQLPREIHELRAKISAMSGPVAKISDLSEEVNELVEEVGSEDGRKPLKVEVADDVTPIQRLTFSTWSFVGDLVILVVLLYFMLASDEAFLRKAVNVLPSMSSKKAAVIAGRAIETQVSRYVITIALINAGLALVLWVCFAVIGLPSPLLWAALAGVLNFVPYAGAVIGVIVVGAVSLLTFPTVSAAMLAPAAYVIVNTLEGTLITPAILGRHMQLSQVAMILWLLLWSFLWGIPGALIAVPMLVATRIVCDNVPCLKPGAVFLGR